MNQIALAIRMLLLLKSHRVIKKQDLAQHLEISEKMVQRLRNQLQMAGYDIESISGQYGGYQLKNSSFLPLSELTQDDLMHLKKAYPYLTSLTHPELSPAFHEVYQKVIANTHDVWKSTSYTSTRRLTMSNAELEQRISLLQQAISQQQRVKLMYSNQKEYTFEPYEIFQIDIFWYVMGYLHLGDLRTFRLNRIQSIELLPQTYLRDSSFHLETHLSQQGFKIEEPITLKGIMKNRLYLMEIVHSDYQEFDRIDRNTFKFSIKFYNRAKAKSFILENGSDCQILEPADLKTFQKEEALKVLALK